MCLNDLLVSSDSPDLLSLADVGKLLGQPGRPASARAVHKWISQGVSTRRGRVKLRAVRRPRGMVCMRVDVEAFMLALNDEDPEGEPDKSDLESDLVGKYPD